MNFSRLRSVSFGVLLESIARDLRYTVRSFRRAPLAALTIVATVALGLGLVAVVFTILNGFVFRVDEVRNPHELFALERPRAENAPPETFTRTQYETLIRETDVFADAFASTGEIDAFIEGHRLEGPLVTGNYFQVLGVNAALGRTFTPFDDEPGGAAIIILSHRAWSLHFAADPGVLNRPIRVNGTQFRVAGVMPEDFRGLAPIAAPDYWAPLSLVGLFRPSTALGAGSDAQGRDAPGLTIVGRLKPGLSRDQALARFLVWDSRAARTTEQPAPTLTLEPKKGTVPLTTDVLLMFVPLFFAFGLILTIGCANVANLLLARAVARQREIGIRLAVGASRRRIIVQLVTESLLLALISAALAFGVSRLALAGVVYAVTSTFPPDIGNLRLAVPPADWRVALFLFAAAVVSTLLFALAPAFQATRIELVRAIRGQVTRDARPSRVRNALVALQVTASVLLLICSAIFLRSSWTAATIDPGIRMVDVLEVTVANEQKRGAILDVVNSEASIAASWPGWLGGRTAFAEGVSGKSPVRYQFVSPEYFEVHAIDLVRGRGFMQSERSSNAAVAIVSEGGAHQLWPGVDAVGQVLRLEPDPADATRHRDDPPVAARTAVVVGVARDVPGYRIVDPRLSGADVYLPISHETARTSLTLRVRGNVDRARHALIERMAAIDPNMGEIASLQTIANAGAYFLRIPFWVTLVLGAIALLLTLSGLFSVLSYLVEQRRREIGVRMALGATSGRIAALVLSQSARPVGMGLLLGGALAAAFGAALLAMPAAALIGSVVRLFDPVAYTVSLLSIVAACTGAALVPALRAARINPLAALRQD
ncbi:MAG TPA: ABC transporter permease [Vicinamibacterales bacterium]|nr:ABC transporter permease [Vicinamibacterales bacterium]